VKSAVNARSLGLLALAQVAIGAAAIFARFALTGGGPVAVSTLRLLLASIPIAIVAAARGAYLRIDDRSERRFFFAGLALAAHFALWIASLRFASVAVSTLLVCSTPIWTEAYVIARRRTLRLDVLAGIILAFAGVAIVAGIPADVDQPLGIALALGGAIAMAVYLTLVRGCDKRYSTLAIVGRTYPVATAVLALVTALIGDTIPPFGAKAAWFGIFAMAFISQLFGHTALNAAVRRLSATFVATVTLIEPAIAAALAAVIFGERPGPGTLVGASVILIAIGLAIRAERATTSTEVVE
jgi:drug/metabolite transporter (DMT)-like permease